MFLAIDVGNTQTTLGLFDEKGQMLHGWRMSTNSIDTADMLHGHLFTFFMKDGLLLDDISAGGIACVVPAISRAWKRCFEVLLKRPLVAISAASNTGVPVHMPHPERVGADRIANAVAARDRYGSPVVVVDFGTATNIDVVDDSGAYRGGAISRVWSLVRRHRQKVL